MASYNLFPGTPSLAADPDVGAVNLGTEFYTTATGWVTHVRYLQPATGGTGTARSAAIYYTPDGIAFNLEAGPFTIPAPAAGTWGTYALPAPLQLVAGNRYRVVIFHPDGAYAATGGYFASGPGAATTTQGILVTPNTTDAAGQDQGSYTYAAGLTFPQSSFNGAAYYSDVTVTDTNPAGSAFTSNPAETVGVADSAGTVKARSAGLADSEGITDAAALVLGYVRSQADTAGIGDSAATVQGSTRSAADTAGLTDASSTIRATAKAAADTASVSDTASTVQARTTAPGDAAGITDAVTAVITVDIHAVLAGTIEPRTWSGTIGARTFAGTIEPRTWNGSIT